MSPAPPRGRTFRGRLTGSMTLLAIVVLAATGTGVYLWARATLLAAFDGALLTIAQITVEAAVDDPRDPVHLHEGVPVPLPPGLEPYEKVMLLRSADGGVNLRTVNLTRGPGLETDPALEARAFAGEVAVGDVRRGGEIYRAVYYPFRDAAGRRLLAVVAIPRRPLERRLSSLLGALGVALVAGGGAAAWGANRLARRLTRPLERIAEGARAVSAPSARLPEVSPDAELREVTAILNEMLGRLEAAIGMERRFLADASHELRSPLANVRGTVEVALRRARSGEEYREALGVTLGEVERLARLVNGLLTLSRADAGQLPFTLAPCLLTALGEEAVKAHAPRAAERGVHLRLEAPAPVEVSGDMDRLREVVDNLLDNALRYAPAGSAVVVSVRREGDRARLSVQDAGPGLSAEEQAHVFDRFYRADRSRARDSGGLGLGLSISRAIVDGHGGRLSVQSAPGAGCTFLVDLPL